MSTENAKPEDSSPETPTNFIRDAIIEDLRVGRFKKVITRFPPEPNGHLHIGHAKALHIDYGMALEFNGEFHLRFDDTNPSKEEEEYVQAIIEDVRWLGCDFGAHLYFASDYFEKMYEWAILLIRAGKAYVCDLNADEIRTYRGTLTESGRNSPNRKRPVEENLDLFERMRKGEFPGGFRTLRAKINMASPNINLRDPVMYRIINSPITVRATSGASTPCTTGRTGLRTPSRTSRTRSARWSTRSIVPSTIGFSTSSPFITRGR